MTIDAFAGIEVHPIGQVRNRLADEVARHLRELILNRDLEPGTPLLQIQLAERLGVSRTPLREAFRILERDGLVKISNGNKTVEVVSLDTERLIDTYQVRGVLDGLAARLAAEKGLTEDDERRLADCIARMEAATEDRIAIAEYGEAHAEFHLTILDTCGNACLQGFAPLVRTSSHMFLTRYLKQHNGEDVTATLQRVIREGNRDHRKIYEAIRQQTADAAGELATRHITKTTQFAQSIAAEERGARAR